MTLTSKFGIAAVAGVTLLAVLQAVRSFGLYIQMVSQGQIASSALLIWTLGVMGCVASCVLAITNARRQRRRRAIGFGAAALVLGGLVIFVALA